MTASLREQSRVAIEKDAHDKLAHTSAKQTTNTGIQKPIPYENIRYNKPTGCPADSIMFDNDEFQRLNYKYGPFTLDACASAFDAKCP